MSKDELISLEEFLNNKRDYSHLLVHLTRSDRGIPASNVLCNILNTHTLKAHNPFCAWNKGLNEPGNAHLRKKFSVVCFTETPIDQIGALLEPLEGRRRQPEPYGLVFTKKYIRSIEGNPVFYVTSEIVEPLHEVYERQKIEIDDKECKLLALTTICEEGNDWHWEREWRFVGDLQFNLNDIYCGLCPKKEIVTFEYAYEPVVFIDPHWGISKTLDKLVKKFELPF